MQAQAESLDEYLGALPEQGGKTLPVTSSWSDGMDHILGSSVSCNSFIAPAASPSSCTAAISLNFVDPHAVHIKIIIQFSNCFE
jgi:hypothetical protein